MCAAFRCPHQSACHSQTTHASEPPRPTVGSKSVDDCISARNRCALPSHRFMEALGYKPNYFEGVVALSQLEFERAKVHSGFLIPSTK